MYCLRSKTYRLIRSEDQALAIQSSHQVYSACTQGLLVLVKVEKRGRQTNWKAFRMRRGQEDIEATINLEWM